jgi:SHS2 domain-containing protein
MAYKRSEARVREFEHTADIGIIVDGNSLHELFANAAYGMIQILFGRSDLPVVQIKKIQINEPAADDLLISWLSELNYLISAQGIAPGEILEIQIRQEDREFILEAQIAIGVAKEPALEIKAVTYHQFYLKEIGPDQFQARIIFDI